MITTILTKYMRPECFGEIVEAWRCEVEEVIVWNNGPYPEPRHQPGVLVVECSENIGAKAKLFAAGLAANDVVILADDDMLPRSGIVGDLWRFHGPDRMVGVFGRKFRNDYRHARRYWGKEIAEPMQVDCLGTGLCMLEKRWLLGPDFRTYPDYIDLYFEYDHAIPAGLKELVVVPTRAYEHLPCSRDEHALYRRPGAWDAKDELYRRYCTREAREA
jgi:hypothetical protein